MGGYPDMRIYKRGGETEGVEQEGLRTRRENNRMEG
jgi:hypothetical protein